MAVGTLDPASPEYAWVASVVDRVSELAGRTARWNGTVVVTDEAGQEAARRRAGQIGADSFYTAADKIALSEEQAATVREAIERSGQASSDPAEAQRRWDDMMTVTGAVGAQAIRLTGPQAQDTGRVAGYEGDLDRGLGQVWTRENLREIFNGSESARLVPAEGVPIRRALTEQDSSGRATYQALAALKLVGRETWRPAAEAADPLIATPPDLRFQAMVESIAGSEDVAADDLRNVSTWTFRQDLGAALTTRDPEAARAAAHDAVNKTVNEIDRLAPSPDREIPAETARFANDPAQAAPGSAATPQADRSTAAQTIDRQPDLREL
ncbi:hypothetical protein [Kribbella sp. NPDC004875]|uniref:hypothetical protein n=1 Tax=Kribbella sp. NPDC004875 TaxID=3364107 RepID=UPI0036B6A351